MILGLALLTFLGVTCFFLANGAPDALRDWYRDALAQSAQLPVNNPDLMYASAMEYQKEGNSAMAAAAARRAVIISPGYAPAHRFLAADDLKNSDFEGAAAECRNIVQNNPNDGAAKLGLATAYQGLGEKEKAEGIYREIVNSGAFDLQVRRAAQRRLGSVSNASRPVAPTVAPDAAPRP